MVGIDHMDQLVQTSRDNIRKDPALGDLLDKGQMEMVTGDGRQGHLPDSPYDAIHVGAAAPILPEAVSYLQ